MNNEMPHILIVDDDINLLKTMSDILEVKGFKAHLAQTGRQALALIEKRPVAVALIDLRLDDISGLEVLRGIKARTPKTECILLTGHATQNSAIEAIQIGAFGYFQKPCDIEQVLLSIQRAAEKQMAEEALGLSEERHRMISSLMSDYVYTGWRLPDGSVQTDWISGAFEQITGYTLQEIQTMPGGFVSLLAIDWEEAFKHQPTISSTETTILEYPIRCKNGDICWLQDHIRPVPEESTAQRIRLVGAVQDITERKQAETERLVQVQRLQHILDTMPEGVVLLDETGCVTLANPLGQQLIYDLSGCGLGNQVKMINGRALHHFLLPPHNGSSHTIEQEDRYFELLARPITPNAAISDWVLLLRDVTEGHERQQYLQIQERLATVGQLAAGIAHDFNNVMAVIILYAQLLQNTTQRPPDELKKLTTIVNQAQHAADMVKQVLDFSRRSVMDRTPIDVLPLLKEMVKLLRNTLPESIEITLTYDAGDYVVRADPTRLQQALMNAAVNARDAMPHGGDLHFALNRLVITPGQPRPLPDVEPGHWLRIAIADTGSGIQSELLPYIFDPFFTTKGPGKGTGLGLAQMYGIVKQHDGSIGVVSSVGEGTTLTIYLPLFITGASALPGPETARSVLTGSETILLVEDNATLRESLSDVLAGLGYTVLRAENGVEALEVLRRRHTAVDLLLTDLVMPGMGGLDLYLAASQQYPAMRLLVMTGYPPGDADPELASMDWIMKPFNISQLVDKIRALLDAPQ
jgi:two-component system cell cycle sensor histidine kinase/response regulator CckA